MKELREFYEVYATYPNSSNTQKVAGYSKETALKVIEDETVKALMKTPHLIMINGNTGEIVAESKPNKKDLNKLINTKIDELIIDYYKQQCIMSGDISPQDKLELETIKNNLSDCIYKICNKNVISFSSENRTLTNFLIVGQKYDFRTELTKYGACLYARDTNGEYCPWIKYNMKEDTFTIMGNTDLCNLWFYDTRPDLTSDKLVEFVKDLNWALEPDEPILLKTLIDPEDWQEIANVQDAYKDERYINMILSKDYYVNAYYKFYDKCIEQAQEEGAEDVSIAADQIFEETATIEAVVGYYLVTYKEDAFKIWKERLNFIVQWKKIKASKKDKDVTNILAHL